MRTPQATFWRGKSVFLTGHTGFKGGWLSLWLQRLGAHVTGFALPPPSEPSLFQLAHIADVVESEIGDIRDYEVLATALRRARPDIVIHLAAQSLVRRSYDAPIETYGTNVMGTVHLLEAVRAYRHAQATLIVTSDKCYENREQIWGYRENEPMGGHDPYSSSKGCAELVTQAYARSYFAVEPACGALASARAGNVIGGGDWAADRLIPDVMRALIRGEAPLLRNPASMRPWQHVLEPLAGYLLAIESIVGGGFRVGDAWNFAPSESDYVTVGYVAEALCRAWGTGLMPQIAVAADAPHEAHRLALDATKARQELDWQPRWSLGEMIARTVAWYRAYAAGTDLAACIRSQIAAYVDGE